MRAFAIIALLLILAFLMAAAAGAEDLTGLQGHVTDASGGGIAEAVVSVRGPSGTRTAQSDAHGAYELAGLAPGRYTVTATKDGFSPNRKRGVAVTAGQLTPLDLPLDIARVEESVTVQSDVPALDIAPENNAGAIILKGADLDALPDDPDELQDALQALAGPAAGPGGGQLFIDGFTGGRLPPKSSIREIRINANPFSAEYDKLGYGRIEIFTKAGTDHFRGEAQLRFNNQTLNAYPALLNPSAPGASLAKPPYRRDEWGGNLSGPIVAKKASYFIDFERRDVNDNVLINIPAIVDPTTLAETPFNESFFTPQHRTTVSPRVDWQISPSQSMTARYTYTSTGQTGAGIGTTSLPTQAYDTSSRQHVFQLTETAMLGKVISETRMRFMSSHQGQEGGTSGPTLQVSGAYTTGGAQASGSSTDQKHWELQNVTSWTMGKHSLRAGVRFRDVIDDSVSRSGFAGTVDFTSGLAPNVDLATGQILPGPDVPVSPLDRYRRTLILEQLGFPAAQIRALGGGASQLTLLGGNPAASISQWDLAPFVQDDWRINPDFILSAGLRYELQDNIHSNFDLAPRLGFAWSPGPKGKNNQPSTVIRGGFGLFYDRVADSLPLKAIQLNGVNEQKFVVDDPATLDELQFDPTGGVTGIPLAADLTALGLPQTTWRLSPDLRTPYTIQSSLSVERQLPANFTVTGTFIASEGRRQLRSLPLNAPLADGTLPLGAAAGNVDQIESTGRLNETQWILGVTNRLSPKLSVFFRYFYTHASSDTDGDGTFPSNPYDLADEYGRSSIDVRHRIVLGGNVTGPWDIRIAPFVIASTGRPFNITAGEDLNGDHLFTDRPGFATNPAKVGVVSTPYGLLDPNPTPDEIIIPRNFGEAPGFFSMNLRLSRTFRFGPQKDTDAPPDGPAGGGGGQWGGGGGRGGGGGGRGGGGRRGGGEGGGPGLTVSFSAQNLFNRVNLSAPIGVLTSDNFGRSLSAVSGFGFGAGPGGGGSAPNRRIELQARLSF
jgi:Carboxypeptidase regulatory-like domain